MIEQVTVDVSGIEYNWLPDILWWWLVPVAVIIFVAAAFYMLASEAVAEVTVFLAGLWFFVGMFFALVLGPTAGVFREECERVTAQLEEQGYENVTLEWRDSFTASKEGKYFKGVFHYVGDKKYQVLDATR